MCEYRVLVLVPRAQLRVPRWRQPKASPPFPPPPPLIWCLKGEGVAAGQKDRGTRRNSSCHSSLSFPATSVPPVLISRINIPTNSFLAYLTKKTVFVIPLYFLALLLSFITSPNINPQIGTNPFSGMSCQRTNGWPENTTFPLTSFFFWQQSPQDIPCWQSMLFPFAIL